MGSWKRLLLLACTASLILNVACDDVQVDAAAQGSVDTQATGDTGETGTTEPTADTQSTGDTPPTDSSCAPRCRNDEVYTDCKSGGCTPYACSELGFPLKCDSNCKPGCVCKDSMLRADNGTCVPRDQCPSCGGDENAGPGCGSYCINCSNYKKKPAVCPLSCILNGCQCKDGFIYDRNVKKCVLPTQCTPTCGANEVYNACTNGGCDARNCTQVGKPVPCVKLDPKSCIKGCVCTDGYLRASNGTCVPKDQCDQPKCTKPNEVYDVCPAPCPPRRCDVDDRLIKCAAPPKPGDAACQPGCRCADGFARNATGTCVLRSQCEKPLKCKANEVYEACPGICPPQICGIDLTIILCPRNPTYGDPGCRPACRCIDGYVRNADNVCIPKDKCPPKCGDNEVYNTCKNGGCSARNCSQLNKPVPCIDPVTCVGGCVCAKGYLRDSNGKCVPTDQCGSARCGENAYWEMCIPGCSSETCDDIGKTNECAIQPAICRTGCRCKPGFWRNKDDKCVPESQCPTPQCPDGETYNKCPTVKCDGDYCPKTRDSPQTCPVGIVCDPPRCTCSFNQKRDWKTGKCIALSYCPPFACGVNEEYQSCPAGCPGENCTDYINDTKCPPFRIGIVVPCKPQCKCKTGYFRNSDGVCIIASKCGPKNTSTTTTTTPAPVDLCPGQNEFFDTCIQGCSNQTCDSIGKIYHCPLQTTQCRTGCRCKSGFYRNSNNVCVDQSQCPSNNTGTTTTTTPAPAQDCGENAYWEKCYVGCSNQTCNEIGVVYGCPAIFGCKSLCRCNPGFWRDANNKCIAESQCPTPPCPEGETYNRCATIKCDGDYCPKTKDSPQSCKAAIACSQPRCTCGFNQKRDWKTGKCIPTRNCPPFACGVNEEYQACPALCPGDNCTDYINDSKCPPGRIGIVLPCNPKCKCKPGYFRNTDGVCIIGSQCGPKKTTTPPTDVTTTTPNPTTGDSASIVASLQAGVTKFTGKFLYDRISANPGQNIIISAYSVFTPLSQLALYANGTSLSQLLAVLNVKNKEDIRVGFPSLTASNDGQTSVNFSVAAKVYSNENYPLSDAFKKDSVDIFRAEANDINFADNVKAAEVINAWVESKTNDRIQSLVSADMFSAMTRLVLVNAIYFKGDWLYTFDKKNTKDADFYLSDGSTKKTKLMYQKGNFRYGEVNDLNLKVLQMFYTGRNFSMVIVLPNENNGVLETSKQLQDTANFNKMLASLSSQTVEVYLPPFEITTSTDLADILKLQDVTQIFDPRNSGLNGLLQKPEDVYVSAAVQKAFVKVDETGSEAAAANGGTIAQPGRPGLPPPPPKVFRADHGFLFSIKVHSTVLFSGVYVK